MAINKVELCGVNTSRLPVLNAEEKETLLKKAREGDAAARERYIQGNLRLVLSVIKRFSNSSENADDLFQIGCIRVSRSLRDTAYRAICARELYLKQNQKEPSIEEIAAEIGIGKEDIVYALDAIQSPMSLYEPIYTEGGDTLYVMDQLSDKKNKEENWVQNLALQDAVARLNERERQIIRMRFYEGQTQMEVAREIGISQAQVSRLEKSALRSMRNYLSDER